MSGQYNQQQLKSSAVWTIASFIQRGGTSSSVISRAGLKALNACLVVGAVQKTTTVSMGGQPGTPQAISLTMIGASSARSKRARVHAWILPMTSRAGALRGRKPIMSVAAYGLSALFDLGRHSGRVKAPGNGGLVVLTNGRLT